MKCGDHFETAVNSIPILFIHYGPASYLPIVLKAARRSNLGKQIFFLGDESNRSLVPSGIQFCLMEDYRKNVLHSRFQNVFVPIVGRAHHFNKSGGVETWLKFVFERWFIILEFLRTHQINAFWIFDSDTLIAGDLACREVRFATADATEQCGGCCLNGYVSSPDVVAAYCEKMVSLFLRPEYLDAQRERLETHSGLAFNEMDAWQTHRAEAGLNTIALGLPSAGEAFDDALAITGGWQVASTKVRGRIPVKRLLRDKRGGFFAFSNEHSTPVRLVTLNLSWLPDFVFQRLAPGCQPIGVQDFDVHSCEDVDFSEPFSGQLRRKTNEMIWRLRSRFLPSKN